MIVNDYGLKEVQLLNTNMKNWKKEDYLNAYCELGNKTYLEFKKFMSEYPDFGILACESILTNMLSHSGNQTILNGVKTSKNSFQKGELIIPDINLSTYNLDEKLLEIIPGEVARKYQILPVFPV